MNDRGSAPAGPQHVDDYVGFCASGAEVVGDFHCASCGYEITFRGALPPCPMCHGTTWEESATRSLSRSRERRS